MKREWGAAALLALLALTAALNIVFTHKLILRVESNLDWGQRAVARGDYDTALHCMNQALTLWQEDRPHSHVFLRHADVDGVNDAFYDLGEALAQKDPGLCAAGFARLRYHLDIIDAMELPSLGSVFTAHFSVSSLLSSSMKVLMSLKLR